MSRAVVVIACCTRSMEGYTYDTAAREYASAVAEVSECLPLLVPVGPGLTDIASLLDVADAILLPGSPSNVEPVHYGDEPPSLPEALDPFRDALTLPLIRAALKRKTPLFAICRGFQELNVALGGSLHQAVHDVAGQSDHRERPGLPIDERYGPAHPVSLRGMLRDWLGRDEIMVNSLHGQGIKRLAAGLQAEAVAEDGLVEAVRGPDDDVFCLGVQWHPEWAPKASDVSLALFRRFGDAARARHNER